MFVLLIDHHLHLIGEVIPLQFRNELFNLLLHVNFPHNSLEGFHLAEMPFGFFRDLLFGFEVDVGSSRSSGGGGCFFDGLLLDNLHVPVVQT